jgi:hypothetical protein
MFTRPGFLGIALIYLLMGIETLALAQARIEGAWAVPDDNLFPSLVIASSTIRFDRLTQRNASKKQGSQLPTGSGAIGAPSKQLEQPDLPQSPPILGVSIHTTKPHTKVHLTINASTFFDESSTEDDLTDANRTYQVYPNMKWNFKALAENTQQTPLNVVFRVRIDDEAEKEIVKTVTVRSIRDCPQSWQDQFGGSGRQDVSWMFTAYVNEDHPWIDTILREAIEQGTVSQFVGQQHGSQVAMQQVFAIWHVLQRRGFRYSSITTTPGAEGKVVSQAVRTFEDSLATAQGNCVDGTVVFASLLRKVGIEPYVVLVPGHAFLAFRLEDGKKFHIYGLETTMVGNTDIRSEKDDANMYWVSAASFGDAIQEGSKKLADASKMVQSGKGNRDYAILSLERMRKFGISPLPSRAIQDLKLPANQEKSVRKINPRNIPKIGVSGRIQLGLQFGIRRALINPGIVLQINNNSAWNIPATVSKLDDQGRVVKSVAVTLSSRFTAEIGHMEGIQWAAGDQFLVEPAGCEPIRNSIAK